MVEEVLSFFHDELNDYLKRITGEDNKLGYIDLDKDPPGFQNGINMFLVNLEEETLLRSPNRYQRIDENGQKVPVQPAFRLNMILLFAAKGSSQNNYYEAIKQLSNILKFFQAHPVMRPSEFPRMIGKGLEKLEIEFNTLTFAQQNEIWSTMKRSYLPSACFRVKMVVIQTEQVSLDAEIDEIEVRSKSK